MTSVALTGLIQEYQQHAGRVDDVTTLDPIAT